MAADTDAILQWLQRSKEEWPIDVGSGKDPPERSIFRVPKTLLEENRAAYIPQIISLGPLHFLKPELEAMETEKTATVRKNRDRFSDEFFEPLQMLARQGETSSEMGIDEGQPSESFFSKAISASKRCYDNIDIKSFFDTENKQGKTLALAWMLFRDACFILEILKGFDFVFDEIYFSDRSRKTLLLIDIVKDIAKLENQIPISLIEALYARIGDPAFKFRDFVISKCNMFSPFLAGNRLLLKSDLETGSHLLGCIRNIVVRGTGSARLDNSPARGTPNSRSILKHRVHNLHFFCVIGRSRSILKRHVCGLSSHCLNWIKSGVVRQRSKCWLNETLRSAVELNKAGIKFEPYFDGGGIVSIRFDLRTSTLHLPAIHVGMLAETVMRNLIAYELYSSACEEKAVTSYVHFMNDLIHGGKDVALLRNSGVIFQDIGSDENVAKMWNTLSNSTCRPYWSRINNAIKEMKHVYKTRKLRILWSEFKEHYFWKPWVFVSSLAATLLLLMTVAQVVCLFCKCNG